MARKFAGSFAVFAVLALGLLGDHLLIGHVPDDLALRLMEDAPGVRGIAVPGMPLTSPGMDGLGRTDPHDVIAFGPAEVEHVFAAR